MNHVYQFDASNTKISADVRTAVMLFTYVAYFVVYLCIYFYIYIYMRVYFC